MDSNLLCEKEFQSRSSNSIRDGRVGSVIDVGTGLATGDFTEDIIELGAMLFPKQYQSAIHFLLHNTVFSLLQDIFGVAASTGLSLNAQSLVLSQIKKQVEEINRKLENVLNEPLKNATNSLKHAMNYIEDPEFYPKGAI